MTAAHCVYNEERDTTMDPSKLFILAGNVHQDYDSPNHNYQLVRRGEVRFRHTLTCFLHLHTFTLCFQVKNVHVYCTYYGLRGNYASDIALLELKKPLVLSQILLPACLDHSGYNDRFLETRPYGRVAGFGRTETQVTSDILRTVSVPYIPYNECRTSKHATQNQEFITLDKFCAGYSNGTSTLVRLLWWKKLLPILLIGFRIRCQRWRQRGWSCLSAKRALVRYGHRECRSWGQRWRRGKKGGPIFLLTLHKGVHLHRLDTRSDIQLGKIQRTPFLQNRFVTTHFRFALTQSIAASG